MAGGRGLASEILENFDVSAQQLNTFMPIGSLLKVTVYLWSTFVAVSRSRAVARPI